MPIYVGCNRVMCSTSAAHNQNNLSAKKTVYNSSRFGVKGHLAQLMPTLSLKWSFIFPIHQSETGEDSHGNANHRLAKRTAPNLGKLSFSQRWPIHSDGLWIGLDPGNQHHDRHPGYFGRTEPGSRPDLCQSRSHSHECGSCGFSDKAPAGKSHPAALSRDNIDRKRLQRLLYGCPAVLANAWLFGP